jgi:hypothetical protein
LDLAPDFDEFCALWSARKVEFVIVGAHALAFHGAPRFTGDLDILVRPTEENGHRLLAAIADFGFPTAPVMPADIVVVSSIGRDCFLNNKRAAGRPKDLADIEALRDTPE